MISDAILNARQAIRKDFSSYDNSFKIKKMKIMSILNDIDNNTSIEDSEITRKFNIWYNLAMLYAKRVSPSLVNWLDNARFTISECLEIYKSTYSTVYKVDKNFEDWWVGQPHEYDTEYHHSWFTENEPVLLEYSGVASDFNYDGFILPYLDFLDYKDEELSDEDLSQLYEKAIPSFRDCGILYNEFGGFADGTYYRNSIYK